MPSKRLRKRIAADAARLLYERQETQLHTARQKAAVMNGVHPKRRPRDLPSSREIREAVDELTLQREGDARPANARERHLATLKLMWRLEHLRPRWHKPDAVDTADESPAHLWLPEAGAAEVTAALDAEGLPYVVEAGTGAAASQQTAPLIRFHVRSARGHVLDFMLHPGSADAGPASAVDPADPVGMTIAEAESWIACAYPDANLHELREGEETWADPYVVFQLLLQRLEGVKQKAEYHPEGDALFHSLQAFDLAREQFPYDEEFLQAALLHDVGKGIDPARHVEAGLEALKGLISPRTTFLIEHHGAARHLRDGSLTGRPRQQILDSEWREDLTALLEIDDAARRVGVQTSTIGEAVAYLRSLAAW